jgi:hypothetical protein
MTRMAVAVLCAAVLATGCGGDGTGEASEGNGRPDRLQVASQGLCDAQLAASEGRVREAEDIFYADSHGYLHELARRLQDTDPAAAAELLEAKQRLESALETSADPPGTQQLIIELERALRDAARSADLPVPLCARGAS